MSDFVAYYWNPDELSPLMAEALLALRSAKRPEAFRAAFLTLLESGESVACGIAMDQFVYGEASSRFGTENPFAVERERILAVARSQLEREPVLRKNPYTGGSYPANHVSALGVLMHLGAAEDLPRLPRFLDARLDANVFTMACLAVSRCAEGAARGEREAVATQLLAIARDEGVAERERCEAIGPIRSSEALAQVVVEPLREVARGEPLALAIQAVWALTGRDELEAELREIVARWPADAPYPANEVRELLGME